MNDRIRFGKPIEVLLGTRELPQAVTSPLKNISRLSSFQVYIVSSVLEAIWQHARGEAQLECSGVLVGNPFRTPDGNTTFVVVAGAVPHHTNRRGAGHVTVGPDEIAEARAMIEQIYPHRMIVGWYHSHPGHGIFLSGQDMVIVRSIYNLFWQLALVVDPLRQELGFFYGREGKRLEAWQEISDAEFLNEPDDSGQTGPVQRTQTSSSDLPHPEERILPTLEPDQSVSVDKEPEQSDLESKPAHELYAFAKAALEKEDWKQALRTLKQIREHYPNFPDQDEVEKLITRLEKAPDRHAEVRNPRPVDLSPVRNLRRSKRN